MSKQERQPLTIVKIGVACESAQNRGFIPDGSRAFLRSIGYRIVGRDEPLGPSYNSYMNGNAQPSRSGGEIMLEVYLQPTAEVLSKVAQGEYSAAIVRTDSLVDKISFPSTDLQLPGLNPDSTIRAAIVAGEEINPEVLKTGGFYQAKSISEKFIARLVDKSRRAELDIEENKKEFSNQGEEMINAWRYA